jgi:hypothetical protein
LLTVPLSFEFFESGERRLGDNVVALGPNAFVGPLIWWNVKVTGSQITFETGPEKIKLKVTRPMEANLLLNYTGIVEGDEIKFTYQSETGRPPVFGPAAQDLPQNALSKSLLAQPTR